MSVERRDILRRASRHPYSAISRTGHWRAVRYTVYCQESESPYGERDIECQLKRKDANVWRALIYTEDIANHIHQPGILGAAVALAIACLIAVIVISRQPQASLSVGSRSLAPNRLPDLQWPEPPTLSVHTAPAPLDHSGILPHQIRVTPSHTDSAALRFDSSLPPLFSAFSANPLPASEPARERNLLGRAFEEPENVLAAPEGDDAPEDAIAPPIWRRIESLIEERRAETLAQSGEALGEGTLIEPAPPIWRDVNALRIKMAQLEGVPEAGGQELAWERPSAPPIWRALEAHRRAGLELAYSAIGSEPDSSHDDEEPRDLSEFVSAPPIWTTWLSGAWPETHTSTEGDDAASAETPSIWSEPPIWASHMRQR